MDRTHTVLALDLGASIGRAIKAVYGSDGLTYEEMRRLGNGPRELRGHLRWGGARAGPGVAKGQLR